VPPVPATTAILGAVEGPARPWALRHRYALLATGVTVLTAIQTRNGQWSSDMWEHVAVVRELIAHPFDPAHPQIRSDAPHPGFSPYTVALGVIGRATGATAVTVLSAAAVGNVVLLLVAWRAFVLEVTRNRRAPFWSLLFALLLWGVSPYRYSGFFGLSSIGFVAPFPSTFATAVALATIVSAVRFARGGSAGHLLWVGTGTALVVLVHPLSAPWLMLALAAVAGTGLRDRRSWAGAAGALALAVVLCLLWPYYSTLDLLSGSGELEALNESMYTDVLLRLFPALLGLIVVVRRSRADPRDLLGWFLLGSAGLWLVGAVTGNTSYGRSLAFVVIVLHVALADGVSRLEATYRWRDAPRRAQLATAAIAALLLVGVVTTSSGWVRMVPEPLLPASVRDSPELVRPDEQYDLLIGPVGRTDVVVGAHQRDNRIIPALAGRTLVLAVPRPFIDDLDERARAQRAYTDPTTDAGRRRAIEDRYDVRFVLLGSRDAEDQQLLDQLRSEGATVEAETDDFVLLALAR
jgi:hypothetical protein